MLFNSTIFLFLFLPVVLAVYLTTLVVLRARGATRHTRVLNVILLSASLVFYTWTESFLVLVMLGSSVLDYACGRLLSSRAEERPRPVRDRLILACSIAGNLGVLAVFKYFNFGLEAISDVLLTLGIRSTALDFGLQLALPLGISFYTFQSMSYTIDVYRGRVAATRSFLDLACYVTMFPQLIAGPIVRFKDVQRSLLQRTLDVRLFASGVQRFVYGLSKKLLIADTLARTADAAFAVEATESGTLSTGVAWIGLVCYTLQIYFDFSGYSDMAIGLGRMFGFHFRENFLHPYASQSLREFWRRWHVSLSSWFRDYLYIPLGGNRASTMRTSFNLGVVFLLCGLWHGASWHFILWGSLHGAVLLVERTEVGELLNRRWRPIRHAYLLAVVMLSWVFFRCVSIEHAWSYLGTLTGFGGGATEMGSPVDPLFDTDTLVALAVGIVISLPVVPVLVRLRVRSARASVALRIGWPVISVLWICLLLLACWMRLAATTHQPFIYFRF